MAGKCFCWQLDILELENDMRVVLVTLLLSILLVQPVWSEEAAQVGGPDFTGITVLDLQTAQRIALEENPGIAAARSRFEQARARVRQAAAAWWPGIDLNGQSRRTRRSDIAYESARKFTLPGQSTDRNIESSTASLQATWVLFDGFFRSFLQDQMEFGKQSFAAARRDVQRRLVSAVAESFLNAQLTQTKVKIAAADKKFYEKQVVDAKNRFEAGAGAWGDVLNFRVQLNSALTRLMLEKRQFEAAKYGLAALLGVPDATFPDELRLAELDQNQVTTDPEEDVQELINEALAARPDLSRLSLQVEEAKAATGKAKASFWPKVQVAGALNGANQDGYRLDEDYFGNYIALNVAWNLFSGGADRAKLFEARQKKREAVYTLADLRNTVVSEVRQYIALLAAAREQVRLQRDSVSLVEENRKLAQNEYEAGASSLVRLNEAQRDLTTTYSRLAQALVSYQLARQRLLAATGKNLVSFADVISSREQPVTDEE